jgi:predicted dehydrogenase
MNTTIAIIGSGFGMYGLLPAFSRIEGCTVISICGKSSDEMLEYCKKFNLKQYSDWKEMIQKERPKAIAIAVIPIYQYEIAKYALENDIAVFAEKPLTSSYQTALDVSTLAKQKGLPNMLDFIFPEIPEWNYTKKIIGERLMDKIIKINVSWVFLSYDLKNQIKSWKTDVKQGGGALSHFFSHTFYYLEYFMGNIANLKCNFSSSEKSLNKGETCIDMDIIFENSCLGNVHMDIAYTGKRKHIIEFHSEKETMTLVNKTDSFVDGFELTTNTIKETQKIKMNDTSNINLNDSEDSRIKLIMPIAQRFINWCNTGIPAKPDFQDGLRVQKLIEMARKSVQNF